MPNSLTIVYHLRKKGGPVHSISSKKREKGEKKREKMEGNEK